MNITEDALKTLYTRVAQYCHTKYGEEPDRIEIDEYGTINARFITYHHGDSDETTECISIENLTEDLDAVAAERKRVMEEAQKKQEEEQKRQNALRIEREKQQRKEQYLKLKKEFEG